MFGKFDSQIAKVRPIDRDPVVFETNKFLRDKIIYEFVITAGEISILKIENSS